MPLIDFMSQLHLDTKRDYLARVTDPDMPKPKAAKLAKQWGYEYWDGDREFVMADMNIFLADGRRLPEPCRLTIA
jgi:hypothetical protein